MNTRFLMNKKKMLVLGMVVLSTFFLPAVSHAAFTFTSVGGSTEYGGSQTPLYETHSDSCTHVNPDGTDCTAYSGSLPPSNG
jgi:hypothetical protein